MLSSAQSEAPKEYAYGVKISVIIGGCVWWFLASDPSTMALVLAAFLLGYLFLGYCVLAILLPGPVAETTKEAFVPIPQSEVHRPKALTL
jgi:hypothetical protein